MARAILPFSLLFLLPTAYAAITKGKANTFAIVGDTGVSAQQLFLGAKEKVYIVDKTENNVAQIGGHPAWATEYDLTTNTWRAMDVLTNAFCAGGSAMGDGNWLNVGGNNAVTTGGLSLADLNLTEGTGAYDSLSGGRAVRWMKPCSDLNCEWTEDQDGIPLNRWYPTLETIEDGSVMIIGGELWGGFVNSPGQKQSVPSYEFWPTRGASVNSTFLEDTQPANLYPLTWLLPSGLIFMQADWQTTLLNYTTGREKRLANIPKAQKTYPASGAVAMLPLTVENNFAPTLLFCGGMAPERDDWDNKKWDIVNTATSTSCVSINPMEKKPVWIDDDDLPEGRGMGNFIILPDQRLFLANGVGKGSSGYGWDTWAINQSYAQDPVMRPTIYNHSAPAGSRFQTDLPESTIQRMYHSSATLLPDGSVFIAGSNPNADVIDDASNATYVFKTEYRAEIFYPDYYDEPRPAPTGIPASITYGGANFDLTLPASSVNGTNLGNIKVALIKTGFSTHAMNMGMRYIQLENTYTGNSDGSATIHVSQLPPNPALLVPGPALLFVTVDNIPSIGEFIMVGSGTIGTQPLIASTPLKASSGNFGTLSKTGTSDSASVQAAKDSEATRVGAGWALFLLALAVL